jgi:hypothetical protein
MNINIDEQTLIHIDIGDCACDPAVTSIDNFADLNEHFVNGPSLAASLRVDFNAYKAAFVRS